MRDLTEEELKLAPEWAVKFDFFGGRLIFMSDVVEVESQTFRFIDIQSGDYWVGSDGDYDLCTRLIIKKPFDITDYGLSDNDIEGIEVIGGNLKLHLMADHVPYIEHTKDDAIAIAKALGVTGEDLK